MGLPGGSELCVLRVAVPFLQLLQSALMGSGLAAGKAVRRTCALGPGILCPWPCLSHPVTEGIARGDH